MKCHIMFCKNN